MRQHRYVVVVLGAGASSPYGFPLGGDLMRTAAATNPFLFRRERPEFGPDDLSADLRFTYAELDSFQHELGRSRCATIDAFLADRPDYVRIGKVVIALVIAACEDPKRFDQINAKGDWIRYLLEENLIRFKQVHPLHAASGSSVQFVTFNYDRSLEFVLLETMAARGLDRATQELALSCVHHVHGHIGGLGDSEHRERRFGDQPTIQHVEAAARSLRFLGEGTPGALDPETERRLACAEHVLFLGFGYHWENLDALRLGALCVDRARMWNKTRRLWDPKYGIPSRAVFHGTAFGLDQQARRRLVSAYFEENRLGDIMLSSESVDAVNFLRSRRNTFEADQPAPQ